MQGEASQQDPGSVLSLFQPDLEVEAHVPRRRRTSVFILCVCECV